MHMQEVHAVQSAGGTCCARVNAEGVACACKLGVAARVRMLCVCVCVRACVRACVCVCVCVLNHLPFQ